MDAGADGVVFTLPSVLPLDGGLLFVMGVFVPAWFALCGFLLCRLR